MSIENVSALRQILYIRDSLDFDESHTGKLSTGVQNKINNKGIDKALSDLLKQLNKPGADAKKDIKKIVELFGLDSGTTRIKASKLSQKVLTQKNSSYDLKSAIVGINASDLSDNAKKILILVLYIRDLLDYEEHHLGKLDSAVQNKINNKGIDKALSDLLKQLNKPGADAKKDIKKIVELFGLDSGTTRIKASKLSEKVLTIKDDSPDLYDALCKSELEPADAFSAKHCADDGWDDPPPEDPPEDPEPPPPSDCDLARVDKKGAAIFEVQASSGAEKHVSQRLAKYRVSGAATLKMGGITSGANLEQIGEDDGGESGSLHLNPSLAGALDILTKKHVVRVKGSLDYERKGFQNQQVLNFGVTGYRRASRWAWDANVGGKFRQNEDDKKGTEANPTGNAFYMNGLVNLKLSDRWSAEAGLGYEYGDYNDRDYHRFSALLGPRINLGKYWSVFAGAKYSLENREYKTSLWQQMEWNKDNHRVGGVLEILMNRPSWALRIYGSGMGSLTEKFIPTFDVGADAIIKGEHQVLLGVRGRRDDLRGGTKDSVLARAQYLYQGLAPLSFGPYVEAGAARVDIPGQDEEWGGQVTAGAMIRFGTPQPSFRPHDKDLTALMGDNPAERDDFALQANTRSKPDLSKVYTTLFGTKVPSREADRLNKYAIAFKKGLLKADYTFDKDKFAKAESSVVKAHFADIKDKDDKSKADLIWKALLAAKIIDKKGVIDPKFEDKKKDFKLKGVNDAEKKQVFEILKKAQDMSLSQRIKNADRMGTIIEAYNDVVSIGDVAPIKFRIGKEDPFKPIEKAKYERSTRVISRAKQEVLKIGVLRHQLSKELKEDEIKLMAPDKASGLAQKVIYAIAILSGYKKGKAMKDSSVIESELRKCAPFKGLKDEEMGKLTKALKRELNARVVGKTVMKVAAAILEQPSLTMLTEDREVKQLIAKACEALPKEEKKAKAEKKDKDKKAEKKAEKKEVKKAKPAPPSGTIVPKNAPEKKSSKTLDDIMKDLE